MSSIAPDKPSSNPVAARPNVSASALAARLANPDLASADRALFEAHLKESGADREQLIIKRFIEISRALDAAYDGWDDVEETPEWKKLDAFSWMLKALGLYEKAQSAFAAEEGPKYFPSAQWDAYRKMPDAELFRRIVDGDASDRTLMWGTRRRIHNFKANHLLRSLFEGTGKDFGFLARRGAMFGKISVFNHDLQQALATPEKDDDRKFIPLLIDKFSQGYRIYLSKLDTAEVETLEMITAYTMNNWWAGAFHALGANPADVKKIMQKVEKKKGLSPVAKRREKPLSKEDIFNGINAAHPEDLPAELVSILKQMGERDFVRNQVAYVTIGKTIEPLRDGLYPKGTKALAVVLPRRVMVETTDGNGRIPLPLIAARIVHEAGHIDNPTLDDPIRGETAALRRQRLAIEKFMKLPEIERGKIDDADLKAISAEASWIGRLEEAAALVSKYPRIGKKRRPDELLPLLLREAIPAFSRALAEDEKEAKKISENLLRVMDGDERWVANIKCPKGGKPFCKDNEFGGFEIELAGKSTELKHDTAPAFFKLIRRYGVAKKSGAHDGDLKDSIDGVDFLIHHGSGEWPPEHRGYLNRISFGVAELSKLIEKWRVESSK